MPFAREFAVLIGVRCTPATQAKTNTQVLSLLDAAGRGRFLRHATRTRILVIPTTPTIVLQRRDLHNHDFRPPSKNPQQQYPFFYYPPPVNTPLSRYANMSKRFLVSVDGFETIDGVEVTNGALDFKTVCYFDSVHIKVKKSTIEQANEFLRKNFRRCTTYVDALDLSRPEDVLSLLDNGAVRVFVQCHLFTAIAKTNYLDDISRLIISIDTTLSQPNGIVNMVAGLQQELSTIDSRTDFSDVGIFFNGQIDLATLAELRKLPKSAGLSTIYLALIPFNADTYKKLLEENVVVIVSRNDLTTTVEKFPWKVSVDALILSALSTDRSDDLYSTLIVDERGICLGLVYSSIESVRASIHTGRGVYKSRKRKGLWHKGETSGDIQELIHIGLDCDGDTLIFTVRQKGDGFCHLKTATCFGPYRGLSRLEKTLESRFISAPENSYTRRLFREPKLLAAKIQEEAKELCDAQTRDDIAAEAADLIYFAMTKCVAAGVSLKDVEKNLDFKSQKITRRKGDAKPEWIDKSDVRSAASKAEIIRESPPAWTEEMDHSNLGTGRIKMRRFATSETDAKTLKDALQRPSQRSTNDNMKIVRSIVEDVRRDGDKAVLHYTHKFDKATSLKTPVLYAPFPPHLMQLPQETIYAIDTSFENIKKFHAAQKEEKELQIETMPGVVCSRFTRPIERVGLYVPGGTAVLPSTALMLGVPAMVADCKTIVIASPPRVDGTLTPEVVYAAHKVGAQSIVLAGGAQAIAAMAYGTESISKVDKILGPGNQFVTAAKMLVSNDTTAGVSIDMPAGPSEVLVIADKTANPAFVASDLLSQAEHGVDSQVVLIAVALDEAQLEAIEDELHKQAEALPRVDIVRGAINHSITLVTKDIQEAIRLSNEYAPEHLSLQVEHAEEVVNMVQNAGSVFIGMWTPETVGDYSAGVNHSLPTYGYAKQYSGVNLGSFVKHITSSNLSREGLKNIGRAVMQMAKVEELEAHRRAVQIRLEYMQCIEGSE